MTSISGTWAQKKSRHCISDVPLPFPRSTFIQTHLVTTTLFFTTKSHLGDCYICIPASTSDMSDDELMNVITVGGNPVSAFLSWRLQATNACDVTLVWKTGYEHVSQYGISFKYAQRFLRPTSVLPRPHMLIALRTGLPSLATRDSSLDMVCTVFSTSPSPSCPVSPPHSLPRISY